MDTLSVRLAILAPSGDTFAYFTYRQAGADGGDGDEIGVCAYGPQAAGLANRVAGRVRVWAAEQAAMTATISIHPRGAQLPPDNVLFTVGPHAGYRARAS